MDDALAQGDVIKKEILQFERTVFKLGKVIKHDADNARFSSDAFFIPFSILPRSSVSKT